MPEYAYTTRIEKQPDLNATYIQVPAEGIRALGSGKKPRVRVTLNDFAFRTTVAVYGGEYFIPINQEIRGKARVEAGDEVRVLLALDTEERLVEIPSDVQERLQAQGMLEIFARWSYTRRKEAMRLITESKTAETRERRLVSLLESLRQTD